MIATVIEEAVMCTWSNDEDVGFAFNAFSEVKCIVLCLDLPVNPKPTPLSLR